MSNLHVTRTVYWRLSDVSILLRSLLPANRTTFDGRKKGLAEDLSLGVLWSVGSLPASCHRKSQRFDLKMKNTSQWLACYVFCRQTDIIPLWLIEFCN